MDPETGLKIHTIVSNVEKASTTTILKFFISFVPTIKIPSFTYPLKEAEMKITNGWPIFNTITEIIQIFLDFFQNSASFSDSWSICESSQPRRHKVLEFPGPNHTCIVSFTIACTPGRRTLLNTMCLLCRTSTIRDEGRVV